MNKDTMLSRLRSSETARNIITLAGGNVAAQAIVLLTIPILSRIYGPEGFGFQAMYLSISAILVVIATGRYEYAILLPAKRADAIAVKSLSRRLLWSAVTVLLIMFGSFLEQISTLLNAETYKFWLLTIPFHVGLIGEISILNLWHTNQKNFKIQSQNRIILSIASFVFQLSFGLFLFPDIRGLVLGLIVSQVIAVIFLLQKQNISSEELKNGNSLLSANFRRYIKMPLLNAPTALLDGIRLYGINLVLGNQSMQALGQYSMASRVVQAPISLISAAISQVFFQKMSTDLTGQLSRSLVFSVLRTSALSLPIFIVIYFVAPTIVPLFLGGDWKQAGLYAQALTPWLFVNFITSPISTVFLVTERQGTQIVFGVVYTLVPIAVLYYLRSNLLFAVWVMSLSMAILLIGFIIIAFFAAKKYDKKYFTDETQMGESGNVD